MKILALISPAVNEALHLSRLGHFDWSNGNTFCNNFFCKIHTTCENSIKNLRIELAHFQETRSSVSELVQILWRTTINHRA